MTARMAARMDRRARAGASSSFETERERAPESRVDLNRRESATIDPSVALLSSNVASRRGACRLRFVARPFNFNIRRDARVFCRTELHENIRPCH